MPEHINHQEIHHRLIQDLFRTLSDADAFCLMLILHACRLVMTERGAELLGVASFEGITSWHAAEVVASLFRDGEKARYTHWSHRWIGRAYAVLENPPAELGPRLFKIRDILESHAWIERVEDEDWCLLTNPVFNTMNPGTEH